MSSENYVGEIKALAELFLLWNGLFYCDLLFKCINLKF